MRVFLRSASLAAALGLCACGRFAAPEPARTPPPPAPAIPVSTLSASLAIPMDGLLRAINAKTASEIARIKDAPANCGIGKCNLDLVATRTGPISGAAQDGRIAFAVP